jgi:restriction system protein
MPDTTSRIEVTEDWYTPSGNRRPFPVYQAIVSNAYLGKTASMRAQAGETQADLHRRASIRANQWNEQAEKDLAKRHAMASKQLANQSHEELCEENECRLNELSNLLHATLKVNDRVDWDALVDTRQFHSFEFWPAPVRPPALPPPAEEKPSFWESILPPLKAKRLQRQQARNEAWEAEQHKIERKFQSQLAEWQRQRDEEAELYQEQRRMFEQQQADYNEGVLALKHQYEVAEPAGVERYLDLVFSRSIYPEHFEISHSVAFHEGKVVVDLQLPAPAQISNIKSYRFIKTKNSSEPVLMKPKEFDLLYDSALKQAVIRTLHEVCEADYCGWGEGVVVNGWVTSIDPATGKEKTNCVISVSASRADFLQRDLANIDVEACLRSLKGQVAGVLSCVMPVVPLLKLDTTDSRFIESEAVLAELNSKENLAEMPWEQFEHLVREVFEKEFAGAGGEVKVTRASNDGGVDAIAFDPDPIRGGKFVIQAKRYTKVVPVSAVRDLYGTMISEGASRGILVTTAHYGSESLEFAKSKPITLINGGNLVYLLEKHGHKVRIDVADARAKLKGS